jgi:hypothetical protein
MGLGLRKIRKAGILLTNNAKQFFELFQLLDCLLLFMNNQVFLSLSFPV